MTSIMQSAWQERLDQRADVFQGSIIRDLLRLVGKPSVISFAGGLPAPECFPHEALKSAADRVLTRDPLAALQYGPTEGYPPLRDLVVEQARRLGISVVQDNVMLTSGSQQVLDIVGRLILEPGDPVAVEDPTYLGALQAWQGVAPTYVTVPMDEAGMDVAALESMLASGVQPRFLYIMPTFQNPTGITLSDERRTALIELAARYNLPILEDDAYGELYYDGVRPTPLAALDVAAHGELRHVIYMSSFSKLLAPGLRVGWVAAPTELLAKLVQVKQGFDLHSSSLSQATVHEACCTGLLEWHVPAIQDIYRGRRDAMIAALDQHMPSGVRWIRPEGGMFTWVMLPEHVDANELFHTAIEHDVAFVPGPFLYARGGGNHSMRLNFSLPTPEQIEEGIRRLGCSIRAMM